MAPPRFDFSRGTARMGCMADEHVQAQVRRTHSYQQVPRRKADHTYVTARKRMPTCVLVLCVDP
eukprot:8603121-Pyramimonas_sp.AAC.1